jgi:hypothetical protein
VYLNCGEYLLPPFSPSFSLSCDVFPFSYFIVVSNSSPLSSEAFFHFFVNFL